MQKGGSGKSSLADHDPAQDLVLRKLPVNTIISICPRIVHTPTCRLCLHRTLGQSLKEWVAVRQEGARGEGVGRGMRTRKMSTRAWSLRVSGGWEEGVTVEMHGWQLGCMGDG